MQDPLDVYQKAFTCPFCRIKFSDVVKIIPDCGEFICGSCYEHLKESVEEGETREYECKACAEVHVLPENGYAVCKRFVDLLRHPIEKPLSDQAKKLKTLIATVQEEMTRLEAFDPRDHVEQHCIQLEHQVRETAESAVNHVNQIEKDLLDQIRTYRQRCLESLNNQPRKHSTKASRGKTFIKAAKMDFGTLRSQVQSFGTKWNDYFNKLNALASESQLEAAIRRADFLQARIETLDQEMKNRVLRESTMQFNPRASFHTVKDHLGELVEIPTETAPTNQKSFTLTGHADTVWGVIFLPDQRMASCSGDKTIKVWDTTSGIELFTLDGHEEEVTTMAMLPNGWLASGSGDDTIKLWDLEAKRQVRTLEGHTGSINLLSVLKNGNLVSSSDDDNIMIWNPCLAENNHLLTIVVMHGNEDDYIIPFGVLSNDFLAVFSDPDDDNPKGMLRVWDSNNGKLVKSLPIGFYDIWAVLVLSNDQIAIGTQKGTIKIIDLEDQSKTRIKENAHDFVSYLLELSNGNFVSAGQDEQLSSPINSIKVWSVSDLSLLYNIDSGHSEYIYFLSNSKGETLLASTSEDKTIKLWEVGF